MTMARGREPNDIYDLLADEVTSGLSASELAVLDGMLADHPEVDADSFHRAAAAIDVAMLEVIEPMPTGVRERLARVGAEFAPAVESRTTLRVDDRADRPADRRSGWMLWSGWLAAAATIVIAVSINLKSGGVDPRLDRQRLIEGGAQVVSWTDWAGTETPGVGGDVVWDEQEQSGYMRFVGLPANDPSKEQYQLWIIDRRGMEQRVSGGVFNSDGGEVVVPIEPGLAIEGAGAFAVTIEEPGGVAVSDMSRKSVIAQL